MTATEVAPNGSQMEPVASADGPLGEDLNAVGSEQDEGAGGGFIGPSPGPVAQIEDASESTYHLKWIQWSTDKIPIVMQSINGPCPLIATMNVLLLREKIKLPTMLEQITATQLLAYLGECIMDSVPEDIDNDENAMLNLEQNIHDAIEILPKLKTGLDVNIRFAGITDFEYTPECIIFDLLRIPLYHGWLCDPNLTELYSAIGNQSYNQLVDNIITNKSSQEPEITAKVLMAEEFLERTASQLTLFGLNQLKGKIKDNEIGILFRNNHFLTLFKRENEIFTLVTDHGYLTEDNIVWEILDNIEGAGRFYDANFQIAEVTNRQVSVFNAIDRRQQQLENDFLMALSLKKEETVAHRQDDDSLQRQEDDFELAKRLQAEENQLAENTNRQVTAYVPPQETIAKRDVSIMSATEFARDGEFTELEPTRSLEEEDSRAGPTDQLPSQSRPNLPPSLEEFPPLSPTTSLAHQAPIDTQQQQNQHYVTPQQQVCPVNEYHGDPRLPRPNTSRRGRTERTPKDSTCSIN